MNNRMENKVAIVTGAAHGIGGAIAERLGSEGAAVVVADIDENAARERADAIAATGARAVGLSVDVRERSQVAGVVERAVAEYGRVDILVSNAGIVDREPFLEMTDELFERVLHTNLYGAFYFGQLVARQMVVQGDGGRIVHVASNSGIFGGRGRAAYGASKAGLINMTQTMAIELAEHDILVNAVAPGPTRTRVTSGDVPSATVTGRMALKRYGEPEEIAAAAAFLASDECSFTTGHVLGADGGLTVTGMMEG